MKDVLMYSDELSGREYSATHPFKPMRAKIMYDLLLRYSLLHRNDDAVVSPPALREDLLYLFHDPHYVEMLKKGDGGDFIPEMFELGLGTSDNPIFEGMYGFSLMVCGATYEGARLLVDTATDRVFNPVGGLHHAGKDHASGFCYVNDIAIAATDLARKGFKVAYIDIDAHHGNGVQDAFYDSDRVLTISLHESGESLYPGTGYEGEIGEGPGRGYNVNVPLRAGTDDEVYVSTFKAVVPPLVEQFAPDVIFAQLGGDSHKDDPLANLNLTSRGYHEVVRRIDGMCAKVLAMGGGGYSPYKTAALWTLAWSALTGVEPVDQFAGRVGGMMYGPETEAGKLEDEPFVVTGPEKDLCARQARRVVEYIENIVFPIHGL